MLLAIDPGTDKCGIAVVSREQEVRVLARRVVASSEVQEVAAALWQEYQPQVILVGKGTGYKPVVHSVARRLPEADILTMEEAYSTERARTRYWKENPPRGWRRFVPRGLLEPPEPVDDYAAVLLAEWFLRETEPEAYSEEA